jgi:hypothetical protein
MFFDGFWLLWIYGRISAIFFLFILIIIAIFGIEIEPQSEVIVSFKAVRGHLPTLRLELLCERGLNDWLGRRFVFLSQL